MLRATRHYKERTNSTGKQQPNEHQRQPNNTSHYGAVILQQPNRQQLRHPNISSAHIQRVMALVMLLTYSSAVFAFQKQIQKATCDCAFRLNETHNTTNIRAFVVHKKKAARKKYRHVTVHSTNKASERR